MYVDVYYNKDGVETKIRSHKNIAKSISQREIGGLLRMCMFKIG